MDTPLRLTDLFTALERPLALRWARCEAIGAEREVEPARGTEATYAGHMNVLRPYPIQVLGDVEVEYLDGLGVEERSRAVDRLLEAGPLCVVVTDGLACPAELERRAREAAVALWCAGANSTRVVTDIQHALSMRLAARQSVHGVFMEVLGIGVLLTGKAGVGKSELALELLSRGHRLVADDAPQLRHVAPDTIEGSCPDTLRDFMEVRGLGIINVRAQFGDSAVKERRALRLVVRLAAMRERAIAPEQRLQGIRREREILGVRIPEVTLPVAPGHNLAVLVECTVRNHLLLAKGYDAAREFVVRHDLRLQAGGEAGGPQQANGA